MEITFLGTGTSHGVPVPGCNCQTCKSSDPRNKRYRTSLFVELENKSLMIDTPPEHRLQMVRWGPVTPDIILFTHEHADHIMGFDDLRSMNWRKNDTIPCFGNKRTVKRIKQTFSYIFEENSYHGGGTPRVDIFNLEDLSSSWQQIITPLPVKHGELDVFGYRIGPLAYITDVSSIPSQTLSKLEGIEVLILGVLRERPHRTHLNLEQGKNLVNKIDKPRTFFTHISHDLEYAETNRKLPEHIDLAYDGLKVKI
ncbi:MBL fold metallo-hydrolase [Halarsenatibacter silvermanii]|uniref:Phosphoribosyl 1,2-cyclic phosphate phosphodiesterase n=1 Tax=Halarsenatibacter silvermanii TaxID=321763 RepID=A0A1G9NXU9_9FIRM|nr:MBL fold metallo-hydrolase [Halarsenatibacter silvermanii]SDL90847.1 phosphoribosyl 1,2-cyclic phosphate phosphodiesterase [Halarsenatibacter silvermanii]